MANRLEVLGRWLLLGGLCAIGAAGATQAAEPPARKPPAAQPAPPADDDADLLEFLGSIDADNEDADWIDFLRSTNIERVAKAKAPAPRKESKGT